MQKIKKANFENTKREEKGITLVALIITIIVLIILAAVTIITFIEMGILETASKGAEDYESAKEYEKHIMNDIDEKANKIVKNIIDIQGEAITEPEETKGVFFDATDKINREKCGVLQSYGEISEVTSKWFDDYNLCTFGIIQSKNPIFCLKEPSDITGHNFLKAELEITTDNGYAWSNVGLSIVNKPMQCIKYKTIYGNNPQAEKGKPPLNTRVIIELDISDIADTETYYGITGNSHQVKIYKMWLE